MINARENISSGIKDMKAVWRRIKEKDFSDNTGIALKNSIYQFFTNLTTKVGSLIFTVILARILMPELYGNYSLALATVLIFATVSDMGIGSTLIRFVSRELGKNNLGKAGAYALYLTKIKVVFISVVSAALLISSRFIAENYYQKPIYFALLAGGLYVVSVGLVSIIQSILQSKSFFRPIFIRETIFQGIRIIAIPLIILYMMGTSSSEEIILFWIIGILALTYLASAISFIFYKKIKIISLLRNSGSLNSPEKKEVNHFLFIISATILSGIFFGYIDTIMLGRFVSSEYIGFYNVAFSFIGALIPLIAFPATALLPSLSSIEKRSREQLFNKSRRITFILSVIIAVLVFAFSSLIVKAIFGESYLLSENILKIFSILYISMPLISIYSSYFIAIGKPATVTRSLIISTTINVALNIVFILYLIRFGEIYAVYGAAAATVISRLYYLSALIFSRRKFSKLNNQGK